MFGWTSDKTKAPLGLRWRTSTWFITLTVSLGILVDYSSYSLTVPVTPYRLAELGYTDVSSKTGWITAAYAGGLLVSSAPIGYLALKIKRRRELLTFFLLFAAAGVVMFMESRSFALMVTARVLQGVAGTGLWTIGFILLAESAKEENIGTAIGYAMIGFSVGNLIGPPVGGTLNDRLGFRAPFVFSLILIGVDLAMRLMIIEKDVAADYIRAGASVPGFEAPRAVMARLSPALADEKEVVAAAHISEWEGLRVMLKSARAGTILIAGVLEGVVLGGLFETGMVLYIHEHYGLSSLGSGLVFIALVVPNLIAAPIIGWLADRGYAKVLATLGCLLAIVSYLLMLIESRLIVMIVFLCLRGVALAAFLTPGMQDLQIIVTETPALSSAHVYAAFNAAYSVGTFVGPIVVGQIFEGVGNRKGWVIGLGISAGLTAILLPAVAWFVGGRMHSIRDFGRQKSLRDVQVEDAEKVATPVAA